MIKLATDIWLAILIAMIILGIPVALFIAWLIRVLRQPVTDDALIRTCGPCSGGFGECQCPRDCGDPHCRHAAPVGDDTLRMLCEDREPTAEETERAIDSLLADIDRAVSRDEFGRPDHG